MIHSVAIKHDEQHLPLIEVTLTIATLDDMLSLLTASAAVEESPIVGRDTVRLFLAIAKDAFEAFQARHEAKLPDAWEDWLNWRALGTPEITDGHDHH